MFEEERVLRVYRITVKKIIERLLKLKDIACEDFKDEVIEQFDGYDYEDIEDVVGFESWEDISKDGKYQLMAKIDHEDAYEFSIMVEVKDAKVSVYNVL